MSTVELKRRLIVEINKTSNQETLWELLRLLEINTEEQEVYKLSDDQKAAVIKSRNQIKSGNYYSNDDVNKEIDKWLSE